MQTERICSETCCYYDSNREGCSYLLGCFGYAEEVGLGEECLHPESAREALASESLAALCAALDEIGEIDNRKR
jgi:hypothetical protein